MSECVLCSQCKVFVRPEENKTMGAILWITRCHIALIIVLEGHRVGGRKHEIILNEWGAPTFIQGFCMQKALCIYHLLHASLIVWAHNTTKGLENNSHCIARARRNRAQKKWRTSVHYQHIIRIIIINRSGRKPVNNQSSISVGFLMTTGDDPKSRSQDMFVHLSCF